MQKLKHRIFFPILFVGGILLALTGLTSCSEEKPARDFSKVGMVQPKLGEGINKIRLDALEQTAREVGAQGGLSWRSWHLNQLLINQKQRLDQIFNFNYLILNHNVLPPILVEGDNTLNLNDGETIRISERDYKIIALPRFVTAPPTWRDYIWMNYQKPEPPNRSLLPANKKELEVWNEYIRLGWNEGVLQADQIFAAQLAKLRRDFSGMLLYRKLLAQNMISAPFVSQAELGVTGNSNELRINDRVLRITSTSELKPDSKVWKPIVVEH
jgi:defect in organelle trafficking protein DotC